MFGDVVSQTKYNNQLCLTVNKPWQETTRSCLCFEFDAPSVNMSEDLYNTPTFADCVKSDEKLANPTHIPQNLRCILLIYFFNVLIGLQCGSTLSYLLTTEQVTWWMIANTVYAIHGIVLTAIDISWMLRPKSWSPLMRNRCCGNVHAPSVTEFAIYQGIKMPLVVLQLLSTAHPTALITVKCDNLTSLGCYFEL